MTEKTVKNKTEQDLFIPMIGLVKAGQTVQVPEEFNNPNFEEIVNQSSKSESTKKEKVSAESE